MAIHNIGLLYDTHIDDQGRKAYDGKATTEAAIDKLNAEGMDWTVHGGDIRTLATKTLSDIDWGGWEGKSDNEFYKSDFSWMKDCLDNRLNGPYYILRGNHDRPVSVLRDVFPSADYSVPDDNGRTDTYWGVEEKDGVRYVYLDTNPSPGYHVDTQTQAYLSSPQLSMLDRLMDQDSSMPTFVFIHANAVKHTELGGLSEGDWTTGANGSYYMTANHLAIQRRLERGSTVLVNSGHKFEDIGRGSRTKNGVTYVLSRHLVHPRDPNYDGDVRWLVVDTTAGTATVHYYDVGADSEGTITSISW